MEWKVSKELVGYEEALSFMDARVAGIYDGSADECVWLLEHPALYTAGTSAKEHDLLDPRFPVFKSGRGGEHTYHGPGQRVAYVMMDLKRRQKVPDIKKYVWQLEEWIIQSLAEFGITGERRCGRVGIWVSSPPAHSTLYAHSAPHPIPLPGGEGSEAALRDSDALAAAGEGDILKEEKIAAIGVRVRHWITLHGIAINVDPDLSHFGGIVPCGISEHGVTSMKKLGVDVEMAALDQILQEKFETVF